MNFPITYSPAYTIVPTYECFNRCSYCNFRVDPGQDQWLSLSQAEVILRSLQSQGVIEILILSGEVHPQHPQRPDWMNQLYELCDLALELGFLPHTNAGPLSFAEMSRLRSVNVSMGLMLEQMTPNLLQTVHRHAPSKQPALRRQQLEWAGELKIPFTTGLLLGIGETAADRIETLETIGQIHQRWGHIQEVILQPHRLGTQQVWPGESFTAAALIEVISLARQILPADISLQIPPNLVASESLVDCLAAGATDLGGIGPTDEVNPDYPHPHDVNLAKLLDRSGYQLQPRLPIYPQYDSWLTSNLQIKVSRWRTYLHQLTNRSNTQWQRGRVEVDS